MKRLKKKNIFLATFFPKVLCFVLILILAGIVKSSFDKFSNWKEAKNILAFKEETIEKEKEKLNNFKKILDYFQNPEYLERTVKEKLNLVRPGEKVIYVLPPKEGQEKKPPETKSFWEKLQEILFKNE